MADIIDISDSIRVINLVDPKFKTMRVSISMVVPLSRETAAMNAILASLVSRATKNYPDYTELSKYLSGLYGSSLASSVTKIGDNQVITISVSGISNKYALNGEDIERELTALLCSAVFDPLKDDNGLFPAQGFEQEKRQLLENIDAEFNDKKVYAKNRCTGELFKNEPAGISRFGTREEVMAIDPEALPKRWDEILKEANFEISILGDCNFTGVMDTVKSFMNFGRSPLKLQNVIMPVKDKPEVIEETMKVAQSKLVMGYRTGNAKGAPVKLMGVIFGGTPSSKLFANVREKMSLCYYCSARAGDTKGVMFVESGVETAKTGEARKAIEEQFDAVKNNDFTDKEIDFARLAMVNSYKSVGDSLYSLESFYLNQMFDEKVMTPEEKIHELNAVTREDIVRAAESTCLDTVYVLKGIS